VKAAPQQELLTMSSASALKSNNYMAFILNSDLKYFKAGPQQVLITVKKPKRGKAEEKKGSSAF
jgi:hypothetical protein